TLLESDDPNDPTPPRNVRAVVIDPADPNILYAAVAGIFRSGDGGTTWTSVNGNLPSSVMTGNNGDGTVTAIVVDQASAGVDPTYGNLYVATALGVFVSTNGGGIWTQIV